MKVLSFHSIRLYGTEKKRLPSGETLEEEIQSAHFHPVHRRNAAKEFVVALGGQW